MAYGGHSFGKKTFHKPTYCHHCSDLLWGLIGQGYICEGTLYLRTIFITLKTLNILKNMKISLSSSDINKKIYVWKFAKRKVYSLSNERKIRIPLLKRLQKKKKRRETFPPKKVKIWTNSDGKVDEFSWNFLLS